MAVPAHDERDFAFAKKFNLEIIPVLDGGNSLDAPYTKDGYHINSDFLDGLNKEEAIDKMLKYLTDKKIGRVSVNYRLRDWIFQDRDIGVNLFQLFIGKMVLLNC